MTHVIRINTCKQNAHAILKQGLHQFDLSDLIVGSFKLDRLGKRTLFFSTLLLAASNVITEYKLVHYK